MKHEQSYGAVIYKIVDEKIYFLIEHMTLGHYSLCKGHIEKDETEEECARREIKEETNLDVILDTSFSHQITYSPTAGVIKDVVFYLATPLNDNIIVQKEEVVSTCWLEFKDAYNRLTFDSDKETIEDANKFILSKKKL